MEEKTANSITVSKIAQEKLHWTKNEIAIQTENWLGLPQKSQHIRDMHHDFTFKIVPPFDTRTAKQVESK